MFIMNELEKLLIGPTIVPWGVPATNWFKCCWIFVNSVFKFILISGDQSPINFKRFASFYKSFAADSSDKTMSVSWTLPAICEVNVKLEQKLHAKVSHCVYRLDSLTMQLKPIIIYATSDWHYIVLYMLIATRQSTDTVYRDCFE